MKNIKDTMLSIFFPSYCLNCRKEGNYLCEDCKECLEISSNHKKERFIKLDDLYFALDYKNSLGKKFICDCKYGPFTRELSQVLAQLIIDHFKLIEVSPRDLNNDCLLIPIPLTKKRLKWRGFNQSEEIAKHLSRYWQIPLSLNCLIKIKETTPQVELLKIERKENIKDAFGVKKEKLSELRNKTIFLIDDVYTTGLTIREATRILKEKGAKKVIGIVVARE